MICFFNESVLSILFPPNAFEATSAAAANQKICENFLVCYLELLSTQNGVYNGRDVSLLETLTRFFAAQSIPNILINQPKLVLLLIKPIV